MIITLMALMACDGGKSDSAGANTDDSATPDDSATDDSGTNKGDDSGTNKGDDSGTNDDSGTGCTKFDWYQDLDGDTYGGGKATHACEAPGKDWTQTGGDCDDELAAVNPDATEICNAIDDDCDKATDADDSDVVLTTWHTDADGDGYGDPSGKSFESCTGAGGYAPDDATHPPDCNDGDDTVYPGAPEICDDIQQNCDTKGWTADENAATWYPASGGYEDWSGDLTAGKPGKATKVDITDNGELVICPGTYYTAINVTTAMDVTIRSLHGATDTIISGGDDVRPIGVFQDYATVTVDGLTLTEGNACYGAAVSTMIVSMCSMGGAGASYTTGVTLYLTNDRIVDNAPTLVANSAVYVGYGGSLNLEGTTVANNGPTISGITAVNTPVDCKGDTKTDAGVWGNAYEGVFMWSVVAHGSDPFPINSDTCDFEGSGGTYTPSQDLRMQDFSGTYDTWDFGDDATFSCDATAVACSK